MSISDLENDEYFSPLHKLEYREFQETTDKFQVWASKKEGKELSRKELFVLVSDYRFYQEAYKKAIHEENAKDAIRIFLSTDPSILEDKKILNLAKTWRIF